MSKSANSTTVTSEAMDSVFSVNSVIPQITVFEKQYKPVDKKNQTGTWCATWKVSNYVQYHQWFISKYAHITTMTTELYAHWEIHSRKDENIRTGAFWWIPVDRRDETITPFYDASEQRLRMDRCQARLLQEGVLLPYQNPNSTTLTLGTKKYTYSPGSLSIPRFVKLYKQKLSPEYMSHPTHPISLVGLALRRRMAKQGLCTL